MKFQNPSFNFFFERTDARTSQKQYAPHFFKVGGIKTVYPATNTVCGGHNDLHLGKTNTLALVPRKRLRLLDIHLV